MATEIQQTPFVKQLAANDRPTRDAAVFSLRTYLSGRRELPANELLKLWKGLFYCMWMSDRPRTQASLADSLSSLVTVLPSSNVLPFLRAFWQTMLREWTNIDVLRMEKFLLLVRRYLGVTFRVMKESGWEEGLVKGHLEVLAEVPCNVEDQRIPNGLRFHVVDIYVDELEKVGLLKSVGDGGEEGREEILDKVLEPLRVLAKGSPTKPVRIKAKEALEDGRLPGNEKAEGVEEEKEDDGWGGFED
ncbi:related to RRP1 protein [Rhynchosporium graminicola]|uniref:Related to RRP1 protein n=1 Tax=Rhynchosporium graminicola TaxID=2792576 RepID=A0A1E1JWV0_9HELO|nr:related to RRP1 protein [Rhynchosporium commune]